MLCLRKYRYGTTVPCVLVNHALLHVPCLKTLVNDARKHFQDVNFPKFLEMDLPLFEGIISDLFPGRKRPVLDYGALNSVMKLVIQAKGLQPHPFFTTKVMSVS